MKKTLSLLALAASALAFAGTASAAEKSPFYMGGNIGFSAATNAPSELTKDDGASYSVYGGYQLTDNLAAEVGYTKLPNYGSDFEKSKSNMWTVQGVYTASVADQVNVFGKAGLAFGKVKFGGDKADGVSPMVGVGAEYLISPKLSAVGEVSYVHDFAREDLNQVTTSVGLKYRF